MPLEVVPDGGFSPEVVPDGGVFLLRLSPRRVSPLEVVPIGFSSPLGEVCRHILARLSSTLSGHPRVTIPGIPPT
ncbi:hypothetical protein PAPYR_12761 [Paratrimastix pyriformis]|uniref:Uncharacterized protein n=1 Tax=Paratrimastix pyriformis TaxID=342808 RepID=A0ABQ8U3K2_9EUKA|nr:hypothetical protein PAPYR_12761 [Paratrimastix pyriformis]